MTENEFFKYVVEKALSFGMKPKNDPFKTSSLITEGNKKNAIVRHNTKDNAYFAFVGKEEETSGRYNGLSFVIFPNKVENEIVTRCVMSIGIGSSTLGNDTALACSPGFRRSFMKLTNGDNCQFFFAENWGDMQSRTPGLEEAVVTTGDESLISTVNHYDNDPNNNRIGLLPAACLLTFGEEFNTINGIPIIDAWLAQYAQWRLWDSTAPAREATASAIDQAREIAKDNDELIEEVKNLLGLTNDKTPRIRNNRYLVIQGAPGCGKTRMALNIAKDFEPDYVTFTQFHAETTYADFVYGIKPILSGSGLGYRGEKGVLLEAIDKARDAALHNKNALLIIDEINRANLSNVLGPVFYLFEANAKDHNYKLNLGWIENNNEIDYDSENKGMKKLDIDKLPSNLYVIATMNTADRSLAVVDFALRRRFTWYTLYPKSLSRKDLNEDSFFDEKRYKEFNDLFEKYATDDELSLQPGHSYFILNKKPEDQDEISDEMVYRLRYELMPLMKEYFNEGFLINAREEFSHLFFKYTKEYLFR